MRNGYTNCHTLTQQNNTNIYLTRLTGLPTASSQATISFMKSIPLIQPVSVPPSPILGLGLPTLNVNGFRLLNAVYKNGSFWSSSNTACIPSGSTLNLSCANVVRLDAVDEINPILGLQKTLSNPSADYYYPALGIDPAGNIRVIFGSSNPFDLFPSLFIINILPNGSTTIAPRSLVTGQTVYVDSRWGDYFGAAVDPSDPSSIWVHGEYVPTTNASIWGTYVGQAKSLR